MLKSSMQSMQTTSYLSGENSAYVEDLYERFLENPTAVPEKWRTYFESLRGQAQEILHTEIRANFIQLGKQPRSAPSSAISMHERKQARVARLVDSYRAYGHYQAKLDPLGLTAPQKIPSLELSHYDLTENDLEQVFNTGMFVGIKEGTLNDILKACQETYCGTLSIEYMYITSTEEVRWIQDHFEPVRAHPKLAANTKQLILEKLTIAEGLEKYLGARYVGQKRFSLEGAESLIPMLDEIIHRAHRQYDVKEIVLGMAHRGRLNVIVNILGKSPAELFKEFEGKHPDLTRSGDVKYHLGLSSDLKMPNGNVRVTLAFNPSHLEIISPVVEGSVRARQERRGDLEKHQVIPVILHGDAAFAGQGVVMETFSLSQARGYVTGGTIHIIVNNQIGFTTSNPYDARSTLYCSDVAKMIQAPIFHVNGDDPEAVFFATQLAIDYRMKFKKDVVIDLVCYRRHGHNEADEPSATQPEMYQRIRSLETTRKLYADKLIEEQVVTSDQVEGMIKKYRDTLDAGQRVVEVVNGANGDKYAVDWTPFTDNEWTVPGDTRLPLKTFQRLAKALEKLPEGMVLLQQVAKTMDERKQMTQGKMPINWGYAETMAYASLVDENYPVRLSGQDSGRGTFAHRHAVLHDHNTGETYTPLQHISEKQAPFVVIDSVLSEEAVLGFEYGYATAEPQTLVLWEAQFGDFANNAQVVIDQFISSGEQKWGRLCGLVMLLPHGFEGQGPEHSSARLERYLQLCAQHNIQVCIPSTPAQVFHMIRRQMLRPYRKPLIVMTPKSLLRHKLAVSTIEELTEGSFQLIIPEIDKIDVSKVDRVVICSGKVYYDLLEYRRANKRDNVAIIRIEQLYPFPTAELTQQLALYKKAKKVVWCQEEPQNQGAWYSSHHNFVACLTKEQQLSYAGREASASPAVGYASVHQEQQLALVKQAIEG